MTAPQPPPNPLPTRFSAVRPLTRPNRSFLPKFAARNFLISSPTPLALGFRIRSGCHSNQVSKSSPPGERVGDVRVAPFVIVQVILHGREQLVILHVPD